MTDLRSCVCVIQPELKWIYSVLHCEPKTHQNFFVMPSTKSS